MATNFAFAIVRTVQSPSYSDAYWSVTVRADQRQAEISVVLRQLDEAERGAK